MYIIRLESDPKLTNMHGAVHVCFYTLNFQPTHTLKIVLLV